MFHCELMTQCLSFGLKLDELFFFDQCYMDHNFKLLVNIYVHLLSLHFWFIFDLDLSKVNSMDVLVQLRRLRATKSWL